MGYKWAKNCKHISHGFYLDEDGKKFATRKGKSIFMEDILLETREIASAKLSKREKLPKKELDERSLVIARAAIIYGDLKNYRSHDMIFNLKRFLEFEGNTGPYLLYTYARARSILRKSSTKKKKVEVHDLSELEKSLVLKLSNFPSVIESAYNSLAPNHIANYAYTLAQSFNEFYHATPVLGSDNEAFLLLLVEAFSQTLKNALDLLGISVLERM
jgi:arginyl-tRNA synthetase